MVSYFLYDTLQKQFVIWKFFPPASDLSPLCAS